MKTMLKAEEIAQLGLAILLNVHLPFDWWVFWAFFLAPDVGFIGYAINTKVGAFAYNLLHHKGVALLVYGAGLLIENNELQLAGLVLFGHSAFDRALGYGLKYNDNFKHTHLGWIGQPVKEEHL